MGYGKRRLAPFRYDGRGLGHSSCFPVFALSSRWRRLPVSQRRRSPPIARSGRSRPAASAGIAAVADYRPTLQACIGPDGQPRLAIRTMTVGGETSALLADPRALTTRLERAACWTCRGRERGRTRPTRMGRAIAASAEAPGVAHRGFLENAGLTRGVRPGVFVTGDLCPSKRPLDRSFFTELAAAGPRAPVALSISGLWLARHCPDFRWLTGLGAIRAISISSGSITPSPILTAASLRDAANYLLSARVDPTREILRHRAAADRQRRDAVAVLPLPGLVSSDPLMETVRNSIW